MARINAREDCAPYGYHFGICKARRRNGKPRGLTPRRFTLVWILAIGTMVYGLSQIHWFMKRAKRRELTRLDREARELVEDPFDMERFEIRNKTEYDELRQRMEYINNTQEYPTTFTMWVQISIGIILPKAVQLLLSSV